MKKFYSLFSLIFVVFLALSSTACGGSQILNLTAFSTTIRIEAHDKKISSSTASELEELFFTLEKEFDKNEPSSVVYKLNNSSVNSKIELNEREKKVLTYAQEYYEFSDGLFNPAVYPLVELWGFDNFALTVDFVPPTEEQIISVLDARLTDFTKVVLEDDAVYRATPVQIDLGGLVKGYAVDKALEIMLNAGHESGYINVGNSSMALLDVNSLNVSHPRKQGETILNVKTSGKKNLTLSTSGDYERFFEHEGERYSHIINPKTGYPIETGIASATVFGGTGAFTDAVTTALCICERQTELIAFIEKITATYPDCEIYIVYEKDGTKELITNKKQGDFTLLDNEYTVVYV